MPTELRPMSPADHRFAWQLNESEVPHVGHEEFSEFERICTESVCRWLATVDGEPAGFLLGMNRDAKYDSPNFQWFRERYPAFLYVDRIAVGKRFRVNGIGRALYQRAEEHARELRLTPVCCEVNLQPPNPVSMAFHLRVGFEQVGSQVAQGKTVAMLVRPVP